MVGRLPPLNQAAHQGPFPEQEKGGDTQIIAALSPHNEYREHPYVFVIVLADGTVETLILSA